MNHNDPTQWPAGTEIRIVKLAVIGFSSLLIDFICIKGTLNRLLTLVTV